MQLTRGAQRLAAEMTLCPQGSQTLKRAIKPLDDRVITSICQLSSQSDVPFVPPKAILVVLAARVRKFSHSCSRNRRKYASIRRRWRQDRAHFRRDWALFHYLLEFVTHSNYYFQIDSHE